MFRFEKLDAWQLSIAFAQDVYVTTAHFPDHERYGLISQMRRSSVSISSNVAEGSGRASDADFARFLEIAYGSLMELVSQLHIAKHQQYLTHEEFAAIYQSSDRLARVLSGLRTSLSSRNAKRPSGPRPSTLDAQL